MAQLCPQAGSRTASAARRSLFALAAVQPDLASTLLFVAITGAGVWVLRRALDKTRVALAALTWPKAKPTLMSVTTRVWSTTSIQQDAVHGPEASYYVSVDNGPFYTRLTRSEFFPVLTYAYEVDGQTHRGANVDPWNAGGYSGADAALVKETHDAWAAAGPSIAYDPRAPSRHFLGWAQFPIAWTLIELVAGLFLATSITIVLDDICALAGVVVPTFGAARRSVFVLVAPALALLYLVVGRSRPADA